MIPLLAFGQYWNETAAISTAHGDEDLINARAGG
jgi:hypothetical protein